MFTIVSHHFSFKLLFEELKMPIAWVLQEESVLVLAEYKSSVLHGGDHRVYAWLRCLSDLPPIEIVWRIISIRILCF